MSKASDFGVKCVPEEWRLGATDAVWHIETERDDDGMWAGIACSETDVIVLPGASMNRKPTCPDCRATLKAKVKP